MFKSMIIAHEIFHQVEFYYIDKIPMKSEVKSSDEN